MKKILFFALVVVFVLSTAMVFAGGEQEETAAEGAEKFKVAVSLPPANNAWQAALLDFVEEEAAKDTDEFDFTIKNAVDNADQLNMLTTFKDGGYDMIMVLPGNGTMMTPICEEIYEDGTKTLIVDRGIESDKYTALLMGDNYGGGQNAAEYIGEFLNGEGRIAILRSYVGIPIDMQRYNGFMDVLEADYPDVEVLVEGDGEFNQEAGLKAMSNILPAYDNIDAVYAQDDEAAIGAITAIRNAQRDDIKCVTGFGGSESAYEELQKGDSIFKASMSYTPSMGAEAVKLAKHILQGGDFEKDNILKSEVVTSENVDEHMYHAY
ncbi:MAG: substrate-binding domain-containing protein [Spirochaetales bacterium]|nr:substrate-binding domain-containing protein [Spirochaetales bacterium]MCF7939004.1 substrate-binding domain-containing protein [Spirochaetales bacterium]